VNSRGQGDRRGKRRSFVTNLHPHSAVAATAAAPALGCRMAGLRRLWGRRGPRCAHFPIARTHRAIYSPSAPCHLARASKPARRPLQTPNEDGYKRQITCTEPRTDPSPANGNCGAAAFSAMHGPHVNAQRPTARSDGRRTFFIFSDIVGPTTIADCPRSAAPVSRTEANQRPYRRNVLCRLYERIRGNSRTAAIKKELFCFQRFQAALIRQCCANGYNWPRSAAGPWRRANERA